MSDDATGSGPVAVIPVTKLRLARARRFSESILDALRSRPQASSWSGLTQEFRNATWPLDPISLAAISCSDGLSRTRIWRGSEHSGSHETAQIHYAARRRGGGLLGFLAADGARGAASRHLSYRCY